MPLLVLFSACSDQLGMEDDSIQDSQITASSQLENHYATYARLNRLIGFSASWTAGASDPHQWIQVDLLVSMIVTGVMLQGRGNTYEQWVIKYQVQHSRDSGTLYKYVQDANQMNMVSQMFISTSCFIKSGSCSVLVMAGRQH